MRLTTVFIKAIATPKKYHDGQGLLLNVKPSLSKSWVFKYTLNKKNRSMGLGPYPAISLKEARLKANQLNVLIAQGIDPLYQRDVERAEYTKQKALTFQKAALAYLDKNEKHWKNLKHRKQWRSTFHTYVFPILGDLPLRDIQTRDIENGILWNVLPTMSCKITAIWLIASLADVHTWCFIRQ